MPRMFRYVFALVCLTIIASAFPCVAGAYTVQAGDTPAGIAKKHAGMIEKNVRDDPETFDENPLKTITKDSLQIGRAVQQECRDRSRMPSSA